MPAISPPEIVVYDKIHSKKATTTPFHLFRGMAPPTLEVKGGCSLVVLGLTLNIFGLIYAEVFLLWGVAYLESLPFSQAEDYFIVWKSWRRLV
jgi:hypothetical protein